MPKQYQSNAEKQKAYRERKRAQLVDPELPVTDLSAEQEGVAPTPPRPPAEPTGTDLESYVAQALYMAELHHSQTSPNATASTKDLASQLERAEHYARWRYAGVVSGEVNGL